MSDSSSELGYTSLVCNESVFQKVNFKISFTYLGSTLTFDNFKFGLYPWTIKDTFSCHITTLYIAPVDSELCRNNILTTDF